jgi:hypothetical protein
MRFANANNPRYGVRFILETQIFHLLPKTAVTICL